MSCVKSQPCNELEAVPQFPKAPWDTAMHGVVTLYDMLKYAAEDFYKLSEDLRAFAMIPNKSYDPSQKDRLQGALTVLHHHCDKLQLPLSMNQIDEVVNAVNTMNNDRINRAFHELQRRVYEELKNKVCFCLPANKVKYWHPLWLVNSPIYDRFRSAYEEFKRAGHCYAFGENTACIFHLMRIVDFGLRIVSGSLGINYTSQAWSVIGNDIQKKMEQKYQTKSDDWKKSEPMYAEILTDIQAISRGHRNPALHDLEKKYDEKDAEYMLTVVEGFMLHLAKHGFRE